MAELLLLGSGAAFNDGSREPTMLALRGPHSTIVIDCGANAIRQLQRLGVPLESIERLILTHSHADHTSGFGLLVEMLWLSGRQRPLPVHGPADAVDVARRLFSQWDTSGWAGLPELQWHEVPLISGVPVATGADFELIGAPGVHSVPVMGLRARDLREGGVLVYGADGEPSPGIRALAHEADLLVHEATGAFPGHSTAAGAAQLASDAGARRLLLVHLVPGTNDLQAQQAAAARIFGREVFIGQDLDRFEF
ncbi:MAG: MBL fold metallo-hydrolase [Ardenticatenaceae bacterium]|nr:MBL fold metallo-hydrolase [Ardenticatenaceae bacterium]